MQRRSFKFIIVLALISCNRNYHPAEHQDSAQGNLSDSLVKTETVQYKAADTVLPDSLAVSETFLYRVRRHTAKFQVIDDTIISFGDKSYITVPRILPYNRKIEYNASDDSLTYELLLQRINLTDIKSLFVIKKDNQIVEKSSDTVVIDPGGHSFSNPYGMDLRACHYDGTHPFLHTCIDLSRGNGLYADFKADILKKYQPEGNGNVIKKILMKRSEGTDPFNELIASSENRVLEYASYIRRYPGDKHYETRYGESFDNFKKLLKDFSVQSNNQTVLEDTSLMDMALAQSQDSIVYFLRQYGFAERKIKTTMGNHVLTPDEFKSFWGTVFETYTGEIRSRDFEELDFCKEKPSYPYIPGYHAFSNSYYPLQPPIPFRNRLVTLLSDDGFEGISFLITIWSMEEENYRLEAILDKSISEAIGGVQIDSLLAIDSTRSIIVGTSGGGDQGDIWGSLWVGVWEMPDYLRIVYRNEWLDVYDGEHSSISYNFLPERELQVTKKFFTYKEPLNESTKKDSVVDVSILVLDSLLDKQHISRLY